MKWDILKSNWKQLRTDWKARWQSWRKRPIAPSTVAQGAVDRSAPP